MLTLCPALAVACFAQTAPQARPGDPIAIVAGKPNYERDIVASVAPRVLQLREQEYELRRQALEDLIRTKLIEVEAKKRGISPENLLEQEVDSKVSEPTNAELEGYYLAVQNHVNQPFDQVKGQLRVTVKQLEIQRARRG